ncbi:SH2 domain-containing protein [Legionella tucsonensis]|uniref:SH2 domain protein n=1 Tax=Legionella tucsonensis TaxID=40335 RepID=A0A0W0ZUL9_9GAMM|nr:SH2 domain-containing protein [Legionella tucsonensis]KTD72802.1 SH2 domain protein [Legionella tucsonensis]
MGKDLYVLKKMSLYHGKLSRDDSEELLQGKPNGSFLIRDSSIKDHHVITYVEDDQIEHQLIFLEGQGNEYSQSSINDQAIRVDNIKNYLDRNEALYSNPIERESFKNKMGPRKKDESPDETPKDSFRP